MQFAASCSFGTAGTYSENFRNTVGSSGCNLPAAVDAIQLISTADSAQCMLWGALDRLVLAVLLSDILILSYARRASGTRKSEESSRAGKERRRVSGVREAGAVATHSDSS